MSQGLRITGRAGPLIAGFIRCTAPFCRAADEPTQNGIILHPDIAIPIDITTKKCDHTLGILILHHHSIFVDRSHCKGQLIGIFRVQGIGGQLQAQPREGHMTWLLNDQLIGHTLPVVSHQLRGLECELALPETGTGLLRQLKSQVCLIGIVIRIHDEIIPGCGIVRLLLHNRV